jgi:hypothetical protein
VESGIWHREAAPAFDFVDVAHLDATKREAIQEPRWEVHDVTHWFRAADGTVVRATCRVRRAERAKGDRVMA